LKFVNTFETRGTEKQRRRSRGGGMDESVSG
jgi:hypothetical protein